MAHRWYVVHVYSGFERKIAESIREQAKQRGLEELFEQVLVPVEKVTEVRRGRKIDAARRSIEIFKKNLSLTDTQFRQRFGPLRHEADRRDLVEEFHRRELPSDRQRLEPRAAAPA